MHPSEKDLHKWISQGLAILGPFPAGPQAMSEAEAVWLLLRASADHALAVQAWEGTPSKKNGIGALEPVYLHARELLDGLESLEAGQWGLPMADAARKARMPLVALKNSLYAKLAGLKSDPSMSPQARLHGPRDASPEATSYARADVLLALAGKVPGTLRGKTPIRFLREIIQALTDGFQKAGNATRGAATYRQRQAEVPDFPEQVQVWAAQALAQCRESLAHGAAPGELWSPGGDPARAKLVKELLFSAPPFSTGEVPISWPTASARSADSSSVEQP